MQIKELPKSKDSHLCNNYLSKSQHLLILLLSLFLGRNKSGFVFNWPVKTIKLALGLGETEGDRAGPCSPSTLSVAQCGLSLCALQNGDETQLRQPYKKTSRQWTRAQPGPRVLSAHGNAVYAESFTHRADVRG